MRPEIRQAVQVDPEYVLNAVAARQGGCVTRSQALDAGVTRDQIIYRVRTGRWQTVGRHGYRVVQIDGREATLRSAVALLPGAVASHYSAAAIHGIERVSRDPISVLVHSQTTHVFPGVLVFRCHDLDSDHIQTTRGIRVTSAARTLVDLAAELSSSHMSVVIQGAIVDGLSSLGEIARVHFDVGRRGKPGTIKVREILTDLGHIEKPESALERDGNRLLRSADLGSFESEFGIPWAQGQRFDVAYARERLAIEWDSRRWHSHVLAFDADRKRDRTAAAYGWTVLRFTWFDVHSRPNEVLSTVSAVLEIRRGHPNSPPDDQSAGSA